MSCELARLDGSYVLGALPPAERQDFERHLAGCDECARAVRELAGLPGLLDRIDPDLLEHPPADDPVPDTLLPALVGEVRRTRRRRAAWSLGAAAAAVVAVAAASVAATGVLSGDEQPGAAPTVSQSAPAGRAMRPVAQGPVHATLAFETVPWGTRLDLTCTYDPSSRYAQPGATYALVVRTRDGRTQQVATWRALPGKTMRVSAATAAGRAQIASVEVRTANGDPVLTLTG